MGTVAFRPENIVDRWFTGPRHRGVNRAGTTGLRNFGLIAALALLSGCETTSFNLSDARDDPALYATIFPYYIETCAVSSMKKKTGLGFEYQGGAGGHAVLYLHGACRDEEASYPSVRMCDESPDGAGNESGVGLSSNGHFSNAAWVATPGRDFFFDGALRTDEGVSRESYERTQSRAKQLGILRGIRFHDDVFDDMPRGMTRDDFMYEASVATDYGISLGRGRLCARLPVSRVQMQRVVTYLNTENARYRDGRAIFEMSVISNNCSHFTHNVLAAAGLWDVWPTGRFFLISAFSFPVPKNEFVDQMLRSNDLPLDDPIALYRDAMARKELPLDDWLPSEPGAIAVAEPMRQENAIYDTDVKLIFYDSPIAGSFQRSFDRIASDPRYTDLTRNLRYFAQVYARIQERDATAGASAGEQTGAKMPGSRIAAFQAMYHDYINRMSERVGRALLALRQNAMRIASATVRSPSSH